MEHESNSLGVMFGTAHAKMHPFSLVTMFGMSIPKEV